MIDLHCDTFLKMYYSKATGNRLLHNNYQVDLEKMIASNSKGQVFAMFSTEQEAGGIDKGYELTLKMIELYDQQLKLNSSLIQHLFSGKAYKSIVESGKMASILGVEGLYMVKDDVDRLECLYDRGVRLMTLIWNYENHLAYPNSRDKNMMSHGLKPFGKEAIEWMNEKGMIIDVSHLNDGGFWDVVEISKEPFVASHSNARTLCNHPRNLTDEMLRTIGNKGGMVGVNFYHEFLSESSQDKKSTIEDIVQHTLYMVDKAGIESVGLGSDFDGIDSVCELKDISYMNNLREALAKTSLSAHQIDKIWYKNAERMICSHIK